MRLVIQIPCLDEEQTLPHVIADLPREIPGVDEVQVLVIDDGSKDETSKRALESGADKVVRHTRRRGLARSFLTGLDAALRMGADVIVNTDGDGQYAGDDVAALVQPILERRADMVIGVRDMAHFSATKRFLQALGSRVVRFVSGTRVSDATSGFRAFSREAALRMNLFNDFTFTLESIIQAGRTGLAVDEVPVRTNPPTRPSRLFSGNAAYIGKSLGTILRVFVAYQPLRAFLLTGAAGILGGLLLCARFLYFLLNGDGGGHIQSLILAAILILVGVQLGIVGLIADLIAANRKISETALQKIRRLEIEREIEEIPERVEP